MLNLKFLNTNLRLHKAFFQVWKITKYSYQNIARPDFGLLYLCSGNATCICDTCIITLNPGDILYLPKGSNYEVNFDIQNGPVENFLINYEVIGEGTFLNVKHPICILNDRSKALFNCFKDLVDAYQAKDMPFMANSLFYLCLHSLQKAMQIKNENEEFFLFQEAAKRLADHFELSVNEVSKDMHMSRSAFQKKFNKYFGTSPIEYRTEKRIEKAKLLLETTDISIKEIADNLGFYDTSYFYKVFVKRCSITPKEYRETKRPIF